MKKSYQLRRLHLSSGSFTEIAAEHLLDKSGAGELGTGRANSAKNLAEKIRKCKAGFLDAINVAIKLRIVAQKMGHRLQIHTFHQVL